MILKTHSRLFLLVSFILSIFALSYFSFFKIPFIFKYLSTESEKNFIFLLLSFVAILFFTIYLFIKKQINLPENKYLRWGFLLLPVVILLSSLFSGNVSNSLFGKYISFQNAISYISLILLSYIIAAYLKKFKRFTWITFVVGNFLFTLPVIIAIILSKFKLVSISSGLVSFIDNWDTVAIVSGIIVIMTLVYFETIAFSKKQKIISFVIILIHLILIACITMPDIWYALTLSSFGILLISRYLNKDKKIKIYKNLSLYVFILSLIFSILFSSTNTKAINATNQIKNFTAKYSGINYSFIKPRFGVSLEVGTTELKRGKIFGTGPASFDTTWEKEKPNSVITSSYWNTSFVSSYSSFTTLFVTLGIVGILVLFFIMIFVFVEAIRNIRKNRFQTSDDEEIKFYSISSVVLLLFSIVSFFVFTNVNLAIILLTISLSFVIGNFSSWKEVNTNRLIKIIVVIISIFILIGFLVSINRIRSSSISSNALSQYQKDNDITILERDLIRSARISGDDSNYRLLSQFYLYKAQNIINKSPSDTDKDLLQKNILSDINNSISSANTSISIDDQDYNNYLSLGTVYNFLMSLKGDNKDNYYKNAKDSYLKALDLDPKNPSIPLTIANLEYSYNQNPTSTLDSIKQSLSIKPNYSSAYYTLSQLAAKYNDRNSAIFYAGQAIQTDPQNVDAYLQYGILTINKNDITKDDLNQAYTAFVSVLNIDPNNVVAAYYLSITYILAKDYDHAQALITALTKVLPNDQKVIDLQSFLNNQKSGTKTTTAPAAGKSTKPVKK